MRTLAILLLLAGAAAADELDDEIEDVLVEIDPYSAPFAGGLLVEDVYHGRLFLVEPRLLPGPDQVVREPGIIFYDRNRKGDRRHGR